MRYHTSEERNYEEFISFWQQVKFEGDCGCLADPNTSFKFDIDIFERKIGNTFCKTLDYEKIMGILEKERPNRPRTTCGCGMECKLKEVFQIDFPYDIPEDVSFTVFVASSINLGMKCIVRNNPFMPNHRPCKIIVPKTVSNSFGVRNAVRLRLTFAQGNCEYVN